jgi:ribosomal protein L25 (general stress protein Ctc)
MDLESKNLIITSAELRKQVADLSIIITARNEQIMKSNKELEIIKQSKSREESELSEIKYNKQKLTLECSDLEKEKIKKSKEIKQLEDNKKEPLKELNRLNSWIVTAKQESDLVNLRNKEFDKKLSEKEVLVNKVLKIENDIKELEKQRDLIRLDIDSLVSEKNRQILLFEEQIDNIKNEITGLQEQAKSALIRKTRIDNECSLRVSDLIEYTDRVKNAWDKVFPGRKMPMLPFEKLQ